MHPSRRHPASHRPWPARLAVLAAAVLLLAACAQPGELRQGQHAVRVEAMTRVPLQKGASFRLVGKNGENAESDLRFAEVSRLVETALSAKGLYAAPIERAQIVVEVDYGIGPSRAQTAFATAPLTGGPPSASGPRPAALPGAPDAPVASVATVDADRLSGQPIRWSLEKRLVLTAHETRSATEDGPRRTLWSVHLSATDMGDDVRKYLPVLAAAAMDAIGTDTHGPATVVVGETDKSVLFVKKGL